MAANRVSLSDYPRCTSPSPPPTPPLGPGSLSPLLSVSPSATLATPARASSSQRDTPWWGLQRALSAPLLQPVAQGRLVVIEHLESRLKIAEQLDDEDGELVLNQVLRQLKEARSAIGPLEKFLMEVSREWKNPENRVLGYVVLSPPVAFNVEEEGFTDGWAVIEIDDSKVDLANFAGNAIDPRHYHPRRQVHLHMPLARTPPCQPT